ncbi:MAG: virulence RhuM family protein [Bacilli bacterium]|nr:virulence RhuM family protein [Bacilli bacterium]
MNNKEKRYDLIKFEDGDFSLDVKVSPGEETVWLTQVEIATLFNKARTTITEHINNIFTSKELDMNTSVGFSDITSNHRPAKLYNLDVILAVGYRVNSKRGILFRRWANSILKQYLLNGYVVNADRIVAYESNLLKLEASYLNIENRLKNLEDTVYAENDLMVFEGEILEPYSFLMKLFFLAKERIIIIDNYADSFLLKMLEDIKVSITIYTAVNSYLNSCTLKDNIKVINTNAFHDRYVVIDNSTYTMGTSFNSIGKKRFTIARLKDIKVEMLVKNIN